MGLKPSEKGKKSEGLAALLRQDDPNERTTSPATEKLEELNAALRYVLDLEHERLCLEGGTLDYQRVEATLKKRVCESYTLDAAPLTEGRVGPERVEVDVASRFGQLAISTENRFTVESKGNFSSCRATHCYFAGRWMYEAVLGTGGIQQIGWATLSCPFNREEGVGDGEDSYAFDGKRIKKWSVDAANYGQPWTPGDVIGCCADFDEGELVFYRNGKSMGTAFRDLRTLKPELGYFPAISLSDNERCTLNFGAKPFYFPVEGYRPCASPPPEGEIQLVEYLMGCLERLVEVSPSGRMLSTTATLFSKSRLTVDEAVLIGSLIVYELRTLLREPYHVLNGVLPCLNRVLGKADAASTASLASLMELMSNALGAVEFGTLTEALLTHIAESCAVFPFRAAELPYTASYPHLSLFVALLKCPVVKSVFFGSEQVFLLVEKCLVRKQPTTEDLKELLPNVWWKGCKDETMSEEIMNSLVSTLSAAYFKIEQLQSELLLVLVSEDIAQNERLSETPKNNLLGFLRYLLEKNAGAARDVPPPGLSNPTVAVSVFHFLMMLLQPYLINKTDESDVLESFPVRELFLKGAFDRQSALDDDLPRLGGLLSHLRREISEEIEEKVEVVIDPDVFSPELPRCHLLRDSIPKLLHILLQIFRLTIDRALKLSMKQFQTESSHRGALLKMEGRIIDPEVAEKEKKQLLIDAQKQKEEVTKAIRESAWCKIVLLTPPKQKGLFLLIVYLSKLMASISKSSSEQLISFVPEVYVEAVVLVFQVLTELEPRFLAVMQLEILGIQHVFSFFVTHFNHPRIISPQVCVSILQAITAIFADKEFLKVCQRNQDAREQLMMGLLKGFDERHWLPITNIFLSIGKGTGFGHASNSSGSPVFRDLLAQACNAELPVLDTFLNRLFNNLNWTLTELAIALRELAELLTRMPNVSLSTMNRQPRKASVLFSLSTNLLRLLELVAGQVPAAFLVGSRLNLTRVVEVVAYILSHMTLGPDSESLNAVVEAPQTGPEWKSKMSRLSILAPVAGILVYLHNHQSSLQASDTHGKGPEMHSVVKILAEELACPAERLHYLTGLDWKSVYSNIQKKTQWIPRLNELLQDYEEERTAHKDIPETCPTEDIPEEFLDPIMMTLMRDPVVLPDSKVTVDRATIRRHLLTSATDPFSRAELSEEMLIDDTILQERIAKWLEETSPTDTV